MLLRVEQHARMAALACKVDEMQQQAGAHALPPPVGDHRQPSDVPVRQQAAASDGHAVAIFGEQVRPFVSTGDPATDQEKCALLLNAANESMRLDPKGPNTLQLVVGSDDWPFPIPLVMVNKDWQVLCCFSCASSCVIKSPRFRPISS